MNILKTECSEKSSNIIKLFFYSFLFLYCFLYIENAKGDVNSFLDIPIVGVLDASQTDIYVTWDGVDEATGYVVNLYLSDNGSDAVDLYNNLDVGLNKIFIFGGLEPNKTYYVSVTAYNKYKKSEPSSLVKVITNGISGRYILIDDGSIVRDMITGLEWSRCSVGQNWNGETCIGNPSRHTQLQAGNLTKPTGFEVPFWEYLRTLVLCPGTGLYDSNGNNEPCSGGGGSNFPLINPIFPATPKENYWSRTPGAGINNGVTVSFSHGAVLTESEAFKYFVRFVRVGEKDKIYGEPRVLNFSAISNDVFKLNWAALEGVTGYILDVSLDKDFNVMVENYNKRFVGKSTEYILSFPIDGNYRYFARVSAFNDKNITGYSEPFEIVLVDTTPPQLISWDVSPREIDTTDHAQTVTVTFGVTDDISGTTDPIVSAKHDETGQSSDLVSATLISGTRLDGVWKANISIPKGSAPGDWRVVLFPLEDMQGNSGTFGPSQGFDSIFVVKIADSRVRRRSLPLWLFVD